jgi:hypothetical protein
MFLYSVAVSGICFSLVHAVSGTAITSGASGFIVKDGGAEASLATSPTHKGLGLWSATLSSTEMTANMVGLLFTGPGAVPIGFTIKTVPQGYAYTASEVWSSATRSLTAPVTGIVSDKTGFSLANGSITSSTFAGSAINSAAISPDVIFNAEFTTDSITASAFSAGAVNKLADGVWDEVIADHLSTGSTGAKLNSGTSGSSGITAADVWGYANRTLTSISSPTTGEIASAVWGSTTRTLTSSSAPTTGEIATAVWNAGTRTLTDITGFSLSESERTAIASVVLGSAIEGSYTMTQILEICSAVLAGRVGIVGNVVTFRDINNTADRVVVTSGGSNGTRLGVAINV